MTQGRPPRKWARRDASLIGIWLSILFGGFVYRPLIVVAAALAVGLGTFFGIRHLHRSRRWEAEGPPEFWADRIKD